MHHVRRLDAALIPGLAVTLLGGHPGAADASSQVPFTMTLTVQDTPVTQNCPTICFANTGTGTAAHLGAVTARGLIVLTSLTFPSATQLKVTTAETYVLTAANGDGVAPVRWRVYDLDMGRGTG